MKLFPAIDIRNSRVVRLTQGDYDRMTVYAESPCETALSFKESGAENLHVVDLDGAKDGTLANFKTIEKVVSQSSLFVQVGGGIRDEKRINDYLSAGAGRVILGTVAVENLDFIQKMTDKYGDKIAVGVDASDGFVAIHGWKTVTDIESFTFCESLVSAGVKTVIYTDISKDGAMSGTNLDAYKKLSEIKTLDIVASGGITYYCELTELKNAGIYGAILGKALYTGALDLKTAIETVRS